MLSHAYYYHTRLVHIVNQSFFIDLCDSACNVFLILSLPARHWPRVRSHERRHLVRRRSHSSTSIVTLSITDGGKCGKYGPLERYNERKKRNICFSFVFASILSPLLRVHYQPAAATCSSFFITSQARLMYNNNNIIIILKGNRVRNVPDNDYNLISSVQVYCLR